MLHTAALSDVTKADFDATLFCLLKDQSKLQFWHEGSKQRTKDANFEWTLKNMMLLSGSNKYSPFEATQTFSTSFDKENLQCWLIKVADDVFWEVLTKWFGIVDIFFISPCSRSIPTATKNTKQFLWQSIHVFYFCSLFYFCCLLYVLRSALGRR